MARRSTKKAVYDPNASAGYAAIQSMRQGLAEQLGRQNAPYTTGTLRNVNVYDDQINNPVEVQPEILDQQYLDESYGMSKKEKENRLNQYNNDHSPGVLESLWNGIKSATSEVANTVWNAVRGTAPLEDAEYAMQHVAQVPADLWRAFQVLYNGSELSSASSRAEQAAMEKEDLDYVENTYKPLVQQYEQLQQKISNSIANGTPELLIRPLEQKLQQVQQELDKQNEYIKTDGRKRSQILRNIFYSTHNRDNMSFLDRISSMWDTIWNSEKMSPWYGNTNSIGGILKGAIDIPLKYLDIWGNTLDFTLHSLDTDYAMNNSLQNVDARDRRFDNLFTDYTKTKGDFKNGSDRLQYFIDLNKEPVMDKYLEAKKDVITRTQNLAQGNYWFDPKKIDKRFMNIVNNDDFGFLGSITVGLPAAIPQLGSSFSDAKDFFASIGVDAAMENVVAPIAIGVASGGGAALETAAGGIRNGIKSGLKRAFPINGAVSADEALFRSAAGDAAGKAATNIAKASVLRGIANSYKTSRGILKSIRSGESLNDAVMRSGITNPEAVKNTIRGVQAAEAGTIVYLTNRLRQNETNAEVMDAYSQRVMDSIMSDNNVDVQKVFDSINAYLHTIDVNPDDIDPQQKLQLALGLNIQTGDSRFEDIKKDARRGLNKVFNDNMTLAAMDYWENLPFLPFFGSAIRDWGKTYSRTMFNRFGLSSKGDQLYTTFYTNQPTANKTYDIMNRTAQAAVDGKVSKAAKWLADGFTGKKPGGGNLARYVMFNNALGFVKRKVKQSLGLGIKEGIEEGQQQLLQSRYQRGEYNDYSNDRSVFDINSFISDLDLGANAVTAYLGINYGDPDNGDDDLRHAMNIGFAVSQLFKAPNVLSNLKKSNADNLRNAIVQLRSDKQLIKLAADNYGRAQDQDHVGVFFEAMQKHGVTADRLRGSLAAMKLANQYTQANGTKNSVVKDEYIDNDMRLLADTDYVMHSSYTKDSLNRLGIKKNSLDHKKYVQNAVRATRDFYDAYIKEIQQGQSANDAIREVLKNIDEETLDDSNPALNEILDNIKVQWGIKKAARIAQYNAARAKWVSENRAKLTEEMSNDLDVWNDDFYDISNSEFVDKRWHKYREQHYKELVDKSEALEKKGDHAGAEKNRQEAIKYRDYSEGSKTLSEDAKAYRTAILKNVFAVHRLNIQRQTLKALKDRLEFNKTLQRELGTDIDTSRLGPMVKYLEDEIKRTETIITPAVEKDFSVDFGELSGFDNYDKELKSYFINRAVRQTLQPIAQAYDPSIMGEDSFIENKEIKTKDGEEILPPNIELSTSYIRWNELTNADKAQYIADAKQEALDNGKSEPTEKEIRNKYRDEHLKKIEDVRKNLAQYKLKLRKLQNTPEKDQTAAQRQELIEARQSIYDAIIQSDLNNGHIREYIINKRKEDNPTINAQDIDDAQNGDPKAQEKIRKAAENQDKKQQEEAEVSGQVHTEEQTGQDLEEDNDGQNDNVDDTSVDMNKANSSSEEILKAAQTVKDMVAEATSKDEDVSAVNDKMRGLSESEKKKQAKLASKLNLNEVADQVLGNDDKANDQDEKTKKEVVDQLQKDQEEGDKKEKQIVTDEKPASSIKSSEKSKQKESGDTEENNQQPEQSQINTTDADNVASSDQLPSNLSEIQFNPFNETEQPNGTVVWTSKDGQTQVVLHRETNGQQFNTVLNPGVDVEYNIAKPWRSSVKREPGRNNHVVGLYQVSDTFPNVIDFDYIAQQGLPRFRFERNGRQFFIEWNPDKNLWDISIPSGIYNDAGMEIQDPLTVDMIPEGMNLQQLGKKLADSVLPKEYVQFIESGEAAKLNSEDVRNNTTKLIDILTLDFGIDYYNPTLTDLERLRQSIVPINQTSRIYISGHREKGYFEVVKDLEDGMYSVHFKPTDTDNPHAFSDEEKAVLFAAVANMIPQGCQLSTHGELTKGGISGINRFLSLGFHKVYERQAKTKSGKQIFIPVMEKDAGDLHRVSLDFEDFLNDPIPVQINKDILDAYIIPDEYKNAAIYSITYNTADNNHKQLFVETDKGTFIAELKSEAEDDGFSIANGQEGPGLGTFDGTVGTNYDQEDTSTQTASDVPEMDPDAQELEPDTSAQGGQQINEALGQDLDETPEPSDTKPDKVTKITDPDLGQFDGYMDGDEFQLTYGGEDVGAELQIQILDDQTIFMDDFVHRFDSGFADMDFDTQKDNTESKDRVRTHYTGTNFLYDPKSDKVGYPRIVRNVGEKDPVQLKFKHAVKTGKELSEKLLQKGWINTCDVYYVVSGTVEDGKDAHDNLTVSLVIDDDKNNATYLLAMRTPGVHEYLMDPTKPADSYNLRVQNDLYVLQKRLAMTGIGDVNKRGNFVNPTVAAAYAENLQATINFEYGRYNNLADQGSNVKEFTDEYESAAMQWYTNLQSSQDPKQRDKAAMIEYQARVKSRRPGVAANQIMSPQDIENVINELRENRNKIIDAYCEKDESGNLIIPTEISNHVRPEEITTSNGRLIDQRDESGMPIFRNLDGDENGFGLSSDIEKLTEQIESEEDDAQFGIGTGAFGNQPYSIIPANDESTTDSYAGKGLAGKIYYILSNKLMPGSNKRGHRVPIQLHEQTFREQVDANGNRRRIVKPEDIHMVLDPNTGQVIDSKYKISAAEAILYLIFNKLDSAGINLSQEEIEAFQNFIINNGEQTLLYTSGKRRTKEQILSAKLPYYTLKQFGWITRQVNGQERSKFICGYGPSTASSDSDQNIGRFGRYEFDRNELFPDENATEDKKRDAEEKRRQVIFQISQHMHWNTEKSVMNNRLGFTTSVVGALRRYFTENPKATEFKLFGCDDLSFKKEDFFESDEDGNITRTKKVNGLAWLIHSGKLQTSTSKQIFYAPFVYASGVKINTRKAAEKHVAETQPLRGKNDPPSLIDSAATDSILRDKEALSHIKQFFGKKRVRGKFAGIEALVKEKRDEILKRLQASFLSPLPNSKGKLQDYILLDISDEDRANNTTGDKIEALLKKKALQYNSFAKKNNLIQIDENKIVTQDFSIPQSAAMFHANTKSQWVIYMQVFDDGSAYIGGEPAQNMAVQHLSSITGVYSTQKQHGKMDSDKTRAWIHKKLGIPTENIVVTSGILRGCSNEKVYGCMQVAVDELTGDIMPTFTFSSQAGRGIGYHESWHYVNLLVNNKATREKIYDEYVKKHPKLKNAPNKKVEELIAEEFRRYMEMMDGSNFTSRLKRLFNNILDFLFAARKKTEMRQIFNAIRDGRAKGEPLDPESLKEFEASYNNIVFNKIKIPGYNTDVTTNLPGINSYKDFYDASLAIGMGVINYYNLTTVDQVEKASGKLFKEYLKSQQMTCTNPSDKAVYKTVLDNPDAFMGVIRNLFGYLGIDAKLEISKEEEQAAAKDTGDSPVDGHLDNNFEVSKKKNVAFRAKLFLMQNQRTHWEDDGNGGHITVYDQGILSTPKYVPFNEAWNKILDNLWYSTSYDARDKNGEYEASSLMGNVKRLAKTDPFFETLYDRLKELEGDPENGIDADIELQNQIFGTVASQKPQIASMRLKDPVWMRIQNASDIYDEAGGSNEVPDIQETDANNAGSKQIPDERREWEVRDDNTIRAKRQLPRNWSSVVAYSPLVSNGKISETAISNLRKIVRDTNRLLLNDKLSIYDKLQQAQDNLTELLQRMSIPVDDQVIDRFLILLGNDGAKTLTPNDKLSVLKKIFGSEKDKQANRFGDITYFINALWVSRGKDYIRVKSKQAKQIPLDQLYNNYKLNSQISILAQAYNDIHPSSAEFSISGPGGKTIYPISQNNEMSDKLNRLNIAGDESIKKLWLDPYCHHSIIRNLTEMWGDNYSPGTRVPATQQFKLCTFVGLDDERSVEGEDYFQINEMEDYIAKLIMTSKDMLVLPTMSDKKTWYAIKSSQYDKDGKEVSNIKLVHDVMTWFDANQTNGVKKLQFSNSTIDIFRGYFLDELDALIQYYDRDNINYLVRHPNNLTVNYHGKVKNGRMQFGGNGGLFRYAYDCLFESDNELASAFSDAIDAVNAFGIETGDAELDAKMQQESLDAAVKASKLFDSGQHHMNLNQVLEFLFKAQQKIEQHHKDYGGIGKLRDKGPDNSSLDLDGYELIRRYLQQLRKDVATKQGKRYHELGYGINRCLIDNVMEEFKRLSQTDGDFAKMRMFEKRDAGEMSGSTIVKKNEDGTVEFNKIQYESFYNPIAIPKFILDQYRAIAKTYGYKDNISGSEDAPKAYSRTNMWASADYALSAIASHVANCAISTIECEKVFMGDPAFFKWKYIDSKLSDGSENINAVTQITKTLPSYLGGDTFTIKVSKLREKHSDKTKRRGSVLSPGENIRDVYGQDILDKYPELNKQDYTFASINDLRARSVYQQETYNQFKRQEFINWVTQNADKFFTKLPEGETLNEYMQKTFNTWYTNYKQFEKDFDAFADKDIKSEIEAKAKESTKPYGDITVADAEVVIRPEMYRYLRIAVGEWTFEEDSDGYSDEKAYRIIEGIGEYADKKGKWMTDPELSKYVQSFQLKPLKMTYFSNENIAVSQNKNGSFNYVNRPIYNKMAIFPMFAYACTTQTGKQLYDRMNKKGAELDMVGFESAVKVGDTQNKYTPFPEKTDASGKSQLPLSLDKLAPINDDISFETSDSDNIIERDSDGNPTGRVVSNTTSVNNPLDRLHVSRQYVKNLRLQMNTDAHEADARAIGTQMFKLCFSNIENDAVYGLNVKDYDGNDVKHYTGRQLKNAIMATINAMTAFGDIHLRKRFLDSKGNIKEKAVMTLCEEIIKNNNLGSSATELINNGGVVASLMSRKLFEQTVIKKINKEVIDKNTQGGSAIQQSMFGFSGVRNVIDYTDNNAYHQLNGGKEPRWLRISSGAYKNSMEVFLSMNFFKSVLPKDAFVTMTYQQQRQYLIDHDLIYGKKTDGTDSKPKPFGIGYRIPTQGQSSIFSFVVADVLPKQSGDTIIVPREFTAQTGSDFDVDKLFLSTLAYKDGEEITSQAMYVEYDQKDKDGKIKHYDRAIRNKKQLDILSKSENVSNVKVLDQNTKDFPNKRKMALLAKTDKRALANQLIHLYMRVLTDPRNFKQGRGSIDTVTNIIKHRILPRIQSATHDYAYGGYDLLPTFQSKTKMEFATGKFGIGPYALNVTNLALTEWANISLDYGKNYWGLGDLDSPLARDGSYVADWLSAMVNAHVDVAKDPYIFDLNLNNSTYSMSAFLLRAGIGAGTFSFLANPYIKTLAQRMQCGKGLYGNNISGYIARNKHDARTLVKDMLTGTVDGVGTGNGGLLNDLEQQIQTIQMDDAKKKRILTWIGLMKHPFVKHDQNLRPENYEDEMRSLGSFVFDLELGLQAIDKYKENKGSLFSKLYGAMCLFTFQQLTPYADQLNQLAQNSRVDTKKFGNTVSLQTNYINKYLKFRYGSKGNVKWVLTKRCQHQINPKTADGKNKTQKQLSQEALDYYFDKTYLNDELVKATSLANTILSKQLYSATPEFQNLLKNVLGSITGQDILHTTDGDDIVVYNPIGLTDDAVTEISNAMDNIVRFKALEMLGEHENYPIDLVRDPQSIRTTLRNILVGDPDSKDPIDRMSVFKQVQYLIDRSKSPVDGKADISDLANNEFLQYITPVPPTKNDKLGFGRLLLKETAVNTGLDQKDVLRSAMYDLLTYDRASADDPTISQQVKDKANSIVQKIAKNVVLYAYYSTYDQNGANSFFELVPLEFRKQYDDALAKGLYDPHVIFDALHNGNDVKNILARNFWWNDMIVPEWIAYKSKYSANQTIHSYADYIGPTVKIKTNLGKQAVPSFYLTNRQNANFFKIIRGDQTILYQKVGVIKASYNTGGKNPKIVQKNVYMPTPKAGLHNGKYHQYEFYVDEKTPSIFRSNQLPDTFSPQAVFDIINKTILKNEKFFIKKTSKKEDPIANKKADDITFERFIDETDLSNSKFYYTTNKLKVPDSDVTVSDDGSVGVIETIGDPASAAKNFADITLKLDPQRDPLEAAKKLADVLKDTQTDPKSITIDVIEDDQHKFKEGQLSDAVNAILSDLFTVYGIPIKTLYVPFNTKYDQVVYTALQYAPMMSDSYVTVVYKADDNTSDSVLDELCKNNPNRVVQKAIEEDDNDDSDSEQEFAGQDALDTAEQSIADEADNIRNNKSEELEKTAQDSDNDDADGVANSGLSGFAAILNAAKGKPGNVAASSVEDKLSSITNESTKDENDEHQNEGC